MRTWCLCTCSRRPSSPPRRSCRCATTSRRPGDRPRRHEMGFSIYAVPPRSRARAPRCGAWGTAVGAPPGSWRPGERGRRSATAGSLFLPSRACALHLRLRTFVSARSLQGTRCPSALSCSDPLYSACPYVERCAIFLASGLKEFPSQRRGAFADEEPMRLSPASEHRIADNVSRAGCLF